MARKTGFFNSNCNVTLCNRAVRSFKDEIQRHKMGSTESSSSGNTPSPCELDFRATCSICLEPYRGRKPKLLPCYHTFCLPCLTALAQSASQMSVKAAAGADGCTENKHVSSLTITCPTCRTVSPIPAGGVVKFQTNFYVDNDADQQTPRPLHCDLCVEDKDASHSCSDCRKNLCSQCSLYHSKFLPGHHSQLLEINSPTTDRQRKTHHTAKASEQTKLLETVLAHLDEEEKEVKRQRKAIEDTILALCDGLIQDAREECFSQLTAIENAIMMKLQDERTAARTAQTRLSDLTTTDGAARQIPRSKDALLTGVLSETDLHRFQRRAEKVGTTQYFLHNTGDVTSSDLLRHVKDFLGCVSSGELASGDQSFTKRKTKRDSARENFQVPRAVPSETGMTAASFMVPCQLADHDVEWKSRLADMEAQSKEFEESGVILQKEVAELRKQVTLLLNAKSTLREDFASMRGEIDLVGEEMTPVQEGNLNMKQGLTPVPPENVRLRKEVTKLQRKFSVLQKENANLRSDLTTMQSVNCDINKRLNSIQEENKILLANMQTMREDNSKISQNIAILQAEPSKQNKDLNVLRGNISKLFSDLKNSDAEMTSQKQELQRQLNVHLTQISYLQTQIKKSSAVIAFQAFPSKAITTTRELILIMDVVKVNIGDGYDGKTGIFTAPITGLYLFLLSSNPDCEGKHAKTDIVVDDARVGYSDALGRHASLGHTVVKVNAGQKVWLRTFDVIQSTYSCSYDNCFSGVLLQPEV